MRWAGSPSAGLAPVTTMPRSVSPDTISSPSASRRALALLTPSHRRAALIEDGCIDLLGGRDPTGSHPGQRLMVSSVLPRIYERLWRPLGARVLMGPSGPGTEGEHRLALDMLALARGETALDLACGPGNFTRSFATAVGEEGLVVGVDASKTMLVRAVRDTAGANVVYVRGDACALPFRDGSFDGICCFAALYLIDDPMSALDEISRLLAPGGRVALLSSCNRGPLPVGAANALVRALSGVRVFGRDELTGALRDRGLTVVEQHVRGFAQFVSARKRA